MTKLHRDEMAAFSALLTVVSFVTLVWWFLVPAGALGLYAAMSEYREMKKAARV